MTALGLALLATPARAAHFTDVADAGDELHLLEVDLDATAQFLSKKTRITRERNPEPSPGQQPAFRNIDVLDHTETLAQALFRLNIGLAHDLELHVLQPYILSREQQWGYPQIRNADGSVDDQSPRLNSTADVDVANQATRTTTPLFAMPADGGKARSLRGGFGDPTIGLAWSPYNQERERRLHPDIYPHGATRATWVIGIDYTVPLYGDKDDPGLLGPTTANPASNTKVYSAHALVHVLSPWTAFSKRFAVLEPYAGLRATLPLVAGAAYSPCYHPELLSATGQKNCGVPAWKGETGYRPSYTATFTLGTELVLHDDPALVQRFAFDLRTDTTWSSVGRNYTQVTDGLGKLTYEEEHLSSRATLGLYGRMARWLHVRASATIGLETPHFLTNEPIGHLLGSGSSVQPHSDQENPLFDYRLDDPGSRLRAELAFVWGLSGSLSLNF